MSAESIVIAVDGPSASGKSTVSKCVAGELGLIYVDSGSYYRGITWKVLREGLDPQSEAQVQTLLKNFKMDLMVENGAVIFELDGVRPGEALRRADVRENVSYIAAMDCVRSYLLEKFRSMLQFGSLVMEGRDIGSVVFPESACKYYLDANAEERARRRLKELAGSEPDADSSAVLNSLARRDKIDSSRKTAPLTIAPGAEVIDSTAMTLEEVVAFIIRDVRERGVL